MNNVEQIINNNATSSNISVFGFSNKSIFHKSNTIADAPNAQPKSIYAISLNVSITLLMSSPFFPAKVGS